MLLVTIVLALIIRGFCKSMNNIEIKYVKKGEDVLLECPVHYPNGAKSIDLRWRRGEWKSTIYAYSQETQDQEYIAPLYEERLIRSNGATLKLLKVKTSDQDLFTCEVTFNFVKVLSSTTKISETQQTSLFLVVNEKPVIIDMSPRNLVVEPDSNVSLFCKIMGQPVPSVTWYRHNLILANQVKPYSTVKEVSIRKTDSKHSIKVPTVRNVMSWYNLTKVNHGHSGDYKCVATNSEGSSEDIIRLIIKGSIYFVDEPTDKIIQMGETVIINCKATGDPNNITYHWFKNHRPIQLILNLEKRFHILKSGSLKIISVESYDGGEYMCVPTNGLQYKFPFSTKKLSNDTMLILRQLKADVYATANITVYFKPIPHSIDQLIYLAINSNGFIPCSLAANPVVKRIYWKKEGDSNGIYRYVSGLQFKKHQNVFTNNTIHTYFHEWDPVTKEDAGLYRCRGFNLMGNGEWSNVIQVIVKKSPYFLTRPATMYKIASGENINIVCRAQGDPFPKVSWFFGNGTKLPDSWTSNKDSGIFTIERASKEHENIYYCKATNPVKRIVSKTTVMVVSSGTYDLLGPTNLTVSCQLFSATVSWTVPDSSGHFSLADLLFKLSSDTKWEKRSILSASVAHQTILGLIPDELYQFCLTYMSRATREHFMSSSVTCKTLGYRHDLVKQLPIDDHNNIIFPAIVKQLGPTPDPPSQIEVNVTLDNKLSISWIPTGNTSWPPILYYRVEYNNIPIDNSQFYSSFKFSLQKYQTHWKQLQPVLHPKTQYILPSTSIISSSSSLYGVLFRVRAYALLSVSRPSHSISIDRSLIDIIVTNESEKKDIERSIASQNKWWPVIFWSLITLVFSSIVVLSILIVIRKFDLAQFRRFTQNGLSRKTSRTHKSPANLSQAQNYLIDSGNDSYIVINNHNAHHTPTTIRNSEQFQNCFGDYVKLSDISKDTKRRKIITESAKFSPGTFQLAEPIYPSQSTSATDSPDTHDLQNKFFHPVTRIKNDVNLYCNCHTYSPTVIVKNELLRSNKSHLMTEL